MKERRSVNHDRCRRLGGVAPVTRQSGKHTSTGFRWAVNRQLRDAICDLAADSPHASPWTAAIYDEARDCGKDHPQPVRITARAWIYVIWRCWQDGTAKRRRLTNTKNTMALRHGVTSCSAGRTIRQG